MAAHNKAVNAMLATVYINYFEILLNSLQV